MEISQARLPETIRRAEGGDLAAANSLAVHYSTIEPADIASSRHWLLFAAERGDCNATEVLADQMNRYGGPPDMKLAKRLDSLERECQQQRR